MRTSETTSDIGPIPSKGLVVVTCMDTRIDPYQILGIEVGDAHIIRNAGGVVTDDTIRSICLSQKVLETKEIILIQHTECGVETNDPDGFIDELTNDAGQRPLWDFYFFEDAHDAVRRSTKRLQEDPFILHKNKIKGYVYQIDSGELVNFDIGQAYDPS